MVVEVVAFNMVSCNIVKLRFVKDQNRMNNRDGEFVSNVQHSKASVRFPGTAVHRHVPVFTATTPKRGHGTRETQV